MFIHSCFLCSHFVLSERVCCHGNDRYHFCILSVQRADHLCCFISIHDRHHNIHKNSIKFSRSAFSEYVNSLLSIPCFCHHSAFILKHKFCNLHIQLIILCQKNMEPLDRSFCFFFRFSPVLHICINLEWNPDHKCSPCAFFTFKGNGSAHFLHQFFCDWHSQPRSGEFCAASCMFLCKWFKNAFLECLCHSNSGVSADKFQCGHCCLFRWDFPTADIDISVFFVIFHRIRQNIHQNPFHMHRTSNKIPVCNFFLFPNDPDILLRSHMFDHTQYFLKNTVQIKWDFFQNHFI